MMEIVSENLPLILGLVLGGLFLVGLALALRTEAGRESLAAAAVRLAVAALAFAEVWLRRQVEPAGQAGVQLARSELEHWLAWRKHKPDGGP